jgi:hypothetical protein
MRKTTFSYKAIRIGEGAKGSFGILLGGRRSIQTYLALNRPNVQGPRAQ